MLKTNILNIFMNYIYIYITLIMLYCIWISCKWYLNIYIYNFNRHNIIGIL